MSFGASMASRSSQWLASEPDARGSERVSERVTPRSKPTASAAFASKSGRFFKRNVSTARAPGDYVDRNALSEVSKNSNGRASLGGTESRFKPLKIGALRTHSLEPWRGRPDRPGPHIPAFPGV